MTEPTFPDFGLVWGELEEELNNLRHQDSPWEKSFCFWSWPNPGQNVRVLAKDAQSLFYNQFWMGRRGQPSGVKLIDDVKKMTKEILQAPIDSSVTLTSGGSESNFTAILAARQWARKERPHITTPNIVVPYSAHPSFEKTGFYLGIDIIRTPLKDNFRADVNAMEAAINESTIMIAGSAPAYPHGLCDPITDIASLATQADIWCHVDACVGGFLLPFLREILPNTPIFEFTIPGVRSISADLHKFGYTPTGISTLTLRDSTDYDHTLFEFDQWPHGEYRTDSFAGSRTSSIVAAAWVTLRHLGKNGYVRLAKELIRTSEKLKSGIKNIGDLQMLAEPEGGIFTFTSPSLEVARIAAAMTAKGFPTYCCKEPPAIHLLLHPMEDERHVDLYLSALADSFEDIKTGKFKSGDSDLAYA